ncbi:hypothetical protein GWI33_018555 [Rhynchophorus ferrugineus]|uniref:Calponin-homology (CH) domain-containing protein n=1 Tax=Rhynchophorus ferrugineus TaxID=354439 RepID=A0A834I004_RHYFE|nr:hypothetical protein GWI33_018555 [Rhynchophorus ferrugineus]
MFFQISPVVRKNTKPVVQKKQENEEVEIEMLSLAPFTPTPKILFENVVVGAVQTRKILIQNPTSQDIDIYINNSVPEDIGLMFSWTHNHIARNTECMLELSWCPKQDEACRHSIIFTDGKRLNRNVAITFKSVSPKQMKSKGVKSKSKTQNQKPATLPLKRKPVSPTKKLRSVNMSPVRINGACYLSPEKYHRPPHTYLKTDTFYTSPKSQQQSQKYARHHTFERLSSKENKENELLLHEPNFLSSTAKSFLSPCPVNFSMDDRRETYILSPHRDRRETYILKVDKTETVFESKNMYVIESPIHLKGTFTMDSISNSPVFRDSLESPGILPLREKNLFTNDENRTFNKDQSPSDALKEGITSSFEHNLRRAVDAFTFSPLISPQKKVHENHFNKFSSPNRTFERTSEPNSTFQLNVSNETYVKSNSSSDISGGTYVKDTSAGDFEDSPLSSKMQRAESPVFLKPRSFDFATIVENNRNNIEPRKYKNLSAIAEESSIISECSFRAGAKRKSLSTSNTSIKRGRLSGEPKTDWSKKGGAAFRVAKTSTGLNLKQFATQSKPQEQSVEHMSTIQETSVKTVIVQNPFLYANVIDPFMSSSIYSTEEWVEQQELHFKKWLNVLLTPPEELDSKTEIDAAKIWQECKKKDVSEAPTKEVISYNYNVNSKLAALRRQSQNMFRSKDMNAVLQKVCQVVDSGKLSIREDKDLHLNLKLKSDIMGLILGYNPLWLRIGLETIYNEVIPLKSNSDANGLAGFIMERFFRDPYLMKKHKTVYAPKYAIELKKFMLKKFLILVYFLDQAKTNKLIPHDPCLFCKNAADKESKLVLTHFARETLSAVGDINKYLRCLGYKVAHQQSYIHEFDYAVKNLGVDLRDGVRLVKVMEILQMRADLTGQLRVPAISRLQKVHNMQVAFNALKESGYEIQYDISPKDIVDGHKENTLSFLWQIIYKYQAPLMVKSATTIQNWFRSLPIMLKRMKLRRIRERREITAKKIQAWYKRQKLSRIYQSLSIFVRQYIGERKRHLAAVKIQSFFKMTLCRRRYILLRNIVIKLEPYIRGWLIRNNYTQRLAAAKIIQKNIRMHQARKRFLLVKKSSITIQTWYTSIRVMRTCRRQYLETKRYLLMRKAAINIQQYYRGLLKMRIERESYIKLKQSTINIQRRYRGNKAMIHDQKIYTQLKQATLFVQRRFRANKLMQKNRAIYQRQKTASIKIQQWYRAIVERKKCRDYYISLQLATKVIQERYRAKKLMEAQKKSYETLKTSIVLVQQKYKALRNMRNVRTNFLYLKNKVIFIQALYRANTLSKLERKRYLTLRSAAICLQRRLRAQNNMKLTRTNYQLLRRATITVQRRFRANKLRTQCKNNYDRLRQAAIVIQKRYRAQKMMLEQKRRYQDLKKATVVIQRRFRQNKIYKNEKSQYVNLKQSVIIVQRQFRAQIEMKIVRRHYIVLRAVTVTVQRRFRAQMLMKQARHDYLELKKATVGIQNRYRAQKSMVKQRDYYQKLRGVTTTVQQKYRAKRLGKLQRSNYLDLKRATLTIQRRYRAKRSMMQQKQRYENLKNAVVFVQQRFRQNKLFEMEKARYESVKQAAIVIQQRFRAHIEMRALRKQYLLLKATTIFIQRRFHAKISMMQARQDYIKLRSAVLVIQRRYRAQKAMIRQKTHYTLLRKFAIMIQQCYRAKKLGRAQLIQYKSLKNASIVFQRRYRAHRMMLEDKQQYHLLRSATILIQRRFRQNKLYQLEHTRYEHLKNSALVIQRYFRAKLQMQSSRSQYIQLKAAVITVQTRYRALVSMRNHRTRFQILKNAVISVQRRYRAHKLMVEQRTCYQELRRCILLIQQRFKANKLAAIQRERYVSIRKSLILIQSRYRAIKAREEFRIKYRTIAHLQRFARAYLIRKVYKPLLTPEAIQARKIAKIQNAAAVKIQSTWRGYSLRKSNIPVMIVIRKHRAIEADPSKPIVPAKTLSQRCDMALSCMTNKKSSLLMIIKALEDLDFITRHCRDTCIRMSMLLPSQLYIILTSAARSRPEMIACNVATFILINFYKYSHTRKNSWNPEYLDPVFNVLLHWCDKEAPLFSTLCTLLWLFAHEEQWKEEIKNVPNIQHRLSKIQTLVERKESMVLKTKRLANVASVFSYMENIKYPTLNANWGLDYDRPNTFTNAVFACSSLIKILGFSD